MVKGQAWGTPGGICQAYYAPRWCIPGILCPQWRMAGILCPPWGLWTCTKHRTWALWAVPMQKNWQGFHWSILSSAACFDVTNIICAWTTYDEQIVFLLTYNSYISLPDLILIQQPVCQKCKNTKVHKFKNAKKQKCKNSKMPKSKSAKNKKKCKNANVH